MVKRRHDREADQERKRDTDINEWVRKNKRKADTES